jgi:hypothetical protein
MRRLFLSSALFLAACSPVTPVIDSAPVDNVESFYGERTPGTWIVTSDASPLTKNVTLNGTFCSQTDAYPVDIRPAFEKSVLDTFTPLADDVRGGQPGAPLPRSATGAIHVRADAMRLTMRDTPAFVGHAFQATLEIDMSFFVDGPRGRLLVRRATGTGRADGNSGVLCEAGGGIFASAARNAIHDGLQHFAVEFASNSAIHRAYDSQRQQAAAGFQPGERD